MKTYAHRQGKTVYRVHFGNLIDLDEKERTTVNLCAVSILNSGLIASQVEQAIEEYIARRTPAAKESA